MSFYDLLTSIYLMCYLPSNEASKLSKNYEIVLDDSVDYGIQEILVSEYWTASTE